MNAPISSGGQWHRDRWQNLLTTDERTRKLRTRAVAFAFAKYAGRSSTASVSLSKLEQETGATRETVLAGVRDLCESGWLTERKPASGRRSTAYELTCPAPWDLSATGRASRPQAEAPETSSGRASRPQAPPVAVGSSPVAVGLDPRSGRLARPNQEINRSIPPTPRDHVAHLLDLQEDDELLTHVDDWLTASGARVPARFIDAAHTRGDLLHQLQAHADRGAPDRAPLPAFVDEPPSTPPLRDQARIRAMRKAARQTTTTATS